MWENAWYQFPTLPNEFSFQELKISNATHILKEILFQINPLLNLQIKILKIKLEVCYIKCEHIPQNTSYDHLKGREQNFQNDSQSLNHPTKESKQFH
jgi:hypothetical protein